MLICILAPSCLIFLILLQIIMHRVGVTRSIIKSFFVCFIIGLITLITTQILFLTQLHSTGTEVAFILTLNLLIYFSSAYCFINFLNIGDTSIRVRILAELADNGPHTEVEIIDKYGAQKIAELRISRLIASDQIRVKGNNLFPGKPRQILLAKAYLLLRRIIFGNTGNKI